MLLILRTLCTSFLVCVLALPGGAQDHPGPFTSLGSYFGSPGVVAPMLDITGSAYDGELFTVSLKNAPSNSPGIFVLGSSKINFTLASGAVLVPSPDLIINATTDENGQIIIPALWPASVQAPAKLYLQFIAPNGPQIKLLSNAVELRALTAAENQTWKTIQQDILMAFPVFDSSRDLTNQEFTQLLADPRLADLAATVSEQEGAVVPDVSGATIDTYTQPLGMPAGTETMAFVPLVVSGNADLIVGAIYLVSLNDPNSLGLAFVFGQDGLDPHIMLYGPSCVPLNSVKLEFTADHKNTAEVLSSLGCSPTDTPSRGWFASSGDPTWGDVTEWLSSDSPAEDLPWWLDVIAGSAWTDAVIGSHNPLSISLCIHFIGVYAVSCFYDGTPSV